MDHRSNYLWLEVTPDVYRLPVAVADNAEELARMRHTTVGSIRSAVFHAKERGNVESSIYMKIEVGEE